MYLLNMEILWNKVETFFARSFINFSSHGHLSIPLHTIIYQFLFTQEFINSFSHGNLSIPLHTKIYQFLFTRLFINSFSHNRLSIFCFSFCFCFSFSCFYHFTLLLFSLSFLCRFFYYYLDIVISNLLSDFFLIFYHISLFLWRKLKKDRDDRITLLSYETFHFSETSNRYILYKCIWLTFSTQFLHTKNDKHWTNCKLINWICYEKSIELILNS